MRWLVPFLALAACADTPQSVTEAPTPPASVDPSGAPGRSLDGAEAGQLVYVPAYSHVFSGDGERDLLLTATLSVRNADPERPIRLEGVRYVGSEGQTIRSYVDAPQALGPLATASFVVAESDRAGGVGASFLVEWTGGAGGVPPVVQAVMISTAGQQGISFVTEGRVVAEAGQP
ncbi:DUF3124 domain-containing protein [Rubrivirga marina]|uniref:DUF3124 domain-containing protein n=1 Tax=Rubrivirga marina TaxID=1196024 RepID=UPI001C52C06F|nr:DUF3124 domain-containing protein [Rubrivirga marina]